MRTAMGTSTPAPGGITAQTHWRPLLVWLGRWAGLYLLSILAYNASYAFTRDVLIYHLQVRPAAWLLQLTLPGKSISCTTSSILATDLQLDILRGCDGVEAWLLLVTALAVFPMAVARRLRSIAYGTLLIFGLNLVRIVTLFHLVMKRPEWFEVAHGLVWQSIMVLAAVLFVLVQFSPEEPSPAAGSTP